jgi:hypothetical protein
MHAARAGAPPTSSAIWRNWPFTQDREAIMVKRYRVVLPLEEVYPASSFLDRIYTEIPAAKLSHPSCYEGEWVCSHGPCPVRSVRLRVKAFYHQHLPRLRCPLCLRTLDFRHWLTVIALQEVPAAAKDKPPRRQGRQEKNKRKIKNEG